MKDVSHVTPDVDAPRLILLIEEPPINVQIVEEEKRGSFERAFARIARRWPLVSNWRSRMTRSSGVPSTQAVREVMND